MGVTTLSVAPNTLIPLGVLMIVYQMYESGQMKGILNERLIGGRVSMPAQYFNPTNMETYVTEVPPTIGKSFPKPPSKVTQYKSSTQKGGRVSMPAQYFNPTNMETYVTEVPPTIGKSWPNPPSKVTQYNAPKQTGGVGLATGFLGKNVTNLSNVLKGQPITYPPLRGLPEYNNSLQLNNRSNPTLNTLDTIPVVPIETNNIPGYNVHPNGNINGSVLMGGTGRVKKSKAKKGKTRKQKSRWF